MFWPKGSILLCPRWANPVWPKGSNGNGFSSNAMIDDVMKSDATLRIVGRGSKTITYNLDDIATGTSLRHFFVPLPVGTYKNLDVSLYGKGKNEPYFTRSISDVTVLRASIVSVPIINGQTGGEYLLSSNTVEVTDEIATNVRVAETDRHTLRYNKNIASENLPEVGEIVISRPHSTIPSGFLGKVIKTSTLEDGSCEVATESVPFTEAFERLYVDKSFELVPEEMDNEGTMTRDKNADTEYSNDVSRFFYSGIAHVNDNNTIHAHGSVRIGAVVSMNFIIDKEQNVNVMKYEIISFSDTDVSLKVETDDYPLFVEYNQQELPFKLQEWEADTVLLADGLLPIFTNVTPTFSIKSRGCLNFNVKLDEETSFRRFTENVGSGWTSYYITGPGGYPEDSFKKKQWTLDKLDEETCFKNYETGEADDYAMIASTVGVSAKIMAYNSDNYSTSINSHITNSLTGGLTLGDNKSLKDSKFTTKTSVGGTFNIKQIEDSKTDTEADLDTVNYTIPFTRNDSSDVQKLIPPEFPLEYKANRYRPSQEGEQGFNASVWAKTKRGILDMEDYKFNIVLMNEKDEEIAVSPDFSYDDKDIECEINHVFENLQEDRKYKAYVRVAHPFLNALVEKNPDAYDHTDGAINMLEDTVLISAYNGIRDVLLRIYRENGGANWEHQKNWGTSLPVSEWDGVTVLDDGTYRFDFIHLNKLTGTMSITNCDKKILIPQVEEAENAVGTTRSQNCLEGLVLENCPNLELEYPFCEIFKTIKHIKIENINTTSIHYITDDGNIRRGSSLKFYEMDYLEDIQIKNCKVDFPLHIIRLPQIKSIVCENLSFEVWSYNPAGESAFMISENGDLLKEINLSDISGLYNRKDDEWPIGKGLYIESQSSLDKIILNNVDCYVSEFDNVKTKELVITSDSACVEQYQPDVGFEQRVYFYSFRNVELGDFYCIFSGYENDLLNHIYPLYGINVPNQVENPGKELKVLNSLKIEGVDGYAYGKIDVPILNLEESSFCMMEDGKLNVSVLNFEASTFHVINSNPGWSELDWGRFLTAREINIKNAGIFNEINNGPFVFKNIDSLQSVNIINTQLADRDIDFSDCESLRKVNIEDCWGFGNNVSLNLCNNLEEIRIIGDNGDACVDIRNTPKLDRFFCQGDFINELLFDSHFDDVLEASCIWCPNLLQKIPNFSEGSFAHDVRYTYYKEYNPETDEYEIKWIDNGFGWWFDGEPATGEHRRASE